MQKRFLRICTVLTASALALASCDTIDILSPPGPAGYNEYEVWLDAVKSGKIQWTEGTDLPNYFKFLKGERGDNGQDAYAIWKSWVKTGEIDDPHRPGKKWSPERISRQDFYDFLRGAKGEDGHLPFINDQGNWQIGDHDTGIRAKGEKGDKGEKGEKGEKGDRGEKGDQGDEGRKGNKGNPGVVGPKGPQGDDGEDANGGGTGAKGDKGDKGDQGDQGNQGDQGGSGDQGTGGDQGGKGDQGDKGDKGDQGDKGEKGDKGDKGDDGANGTDGNDATSEEDRIEIKNGTWHINGKDTGVKADGASAFELWVKDVKDGLIRTPEDTVWPSDKVELAHFWEYVKGKKCEIVVTPLKIVSITNSAEGTTNKSVIKIKTDANAKIKYQFSGVGTLPQGTEVVTTVDADGNGEYTLTLTNPSGNAPITVHIWAESENKIRSYQHHITIGAHTQGDTSTNTAD